MKLLPLDDPRWKTLCHRNWSDGRPSASVPDAPFVPDVLALLVEQPERTDLFSDLSEWLCSEGTAWAASYAVVPYAVDFSRRLKPEKRFEYLYFVGLVVQCSCPDMGSAFEVKSFLTSDYQKALELALPLAAESLLDHHDQTETRCLLSTLAALKGHPQIAEVLDNAGCICGECPNCGESVYPDELQNIV